MYLTTLNTHKTFMPLVGFEIAIPASERPQTQTLDRAATGIGFFTLATLFKIPFQKLAKLSSHSFEFNPIRH